MQDHNYKKTFFSKHDHIYFASAPGRLDVMGGIADYSGSYVLQMPIAERTYVSLALRNDGVLRVYSQNSAETGMASEAEITLSEFMNNGQLIDFSEIQNVFKQNELSSWAAYVFGCVLMLMVEYQAKCEGIDAWVESEVPIGKGVSSSAALEVATLTALCHATNIELNDNELPVLAQKVENLIVGAPCGLMDQLATYHGKEKKLLPILCRPDHVYEPISIPRDIRFIAIDSGVRHSVSGASYTDVRTAAFMGYSIIAKLNGVVQATIQECRLKGKRDHLPYNGYLTEITPSVFETKYSEHFPVMMRGQDFIEHYGEIIDPITQVNPENNYAILACTRHPVYEHHRVQQFYLLLQLLNEPISDGVRKQTLEQLGELMYQSHSSYSLCGLGSDATDHLVQLAREAGLDNGIYGAKITGGGGGGTVCFLAEGPQGLDTVQDIAKKHAKQFSCEKTIFIGSSDGAKWVESELFTINPTKNEG